jgi:hypothetical protein
MVSKSGSEPYCALKKRLEAVGKPIGDRVVDKLAAEAESRYAPKVVQYKDDWLASRKEKGQAYDLYKQGSPDINWVNNKFKTIVLLMLDASVPTEMQLALKAYCEAFFMGCDVKVKGPGEMWQ